MARKHLAICRSHTRGWPCQAKLCTRAWSEEILLFSVMNIYADIWVCVGHKSIMVPIVVCPFNSAASPRTTIRREGFYQLRARCLLLIAKESSPLSLTSYWLTNLWLETIQPWKTYFQISSVAMQLSWRASIDLPSKGWTRTHVKLFCIYGWELWAQRPWLGSKTHIWGNWRILVCASKNPLPLPGLTIEDTREVLCHILRGCPGEEIPFKRLLETLRLVSIEGKKRVEVETRLLLREIEVWRELYQ